MYLMMIFCRIISEFEAIRERALTKPEDTREMIDMLKFVEEAKTKTLVKLDSDIKVSFSFSFKKSPSFVFYVTSEA